MVILRTRNKITDFLMILAWASPFNMTHFEIFYFVLMLSILLSNHMFNTYSYKTVPLAAIQNLQKKSFFQLLQMFYFKLWVRMHAFV